MNDQHGGFAWQAGSWTVRHRKLRERLVGCGEWQQFDGSCQAHDILGGAGNVEDNILNDPAGSYRAIAVRRIDPASGDWTIFWFDGRFAYIDPPMSGRFDGSIGIFFGKDKLRDTPILVRFIWSAVDTDRPRWEQAFSNDDGANWETNWIMDFERAA